MEKLVNKSVKNVWISDLLYFFLKVHCYCIAYWKVLSSFASAAIRIRTSGIRKSLTQSADKNADGNISQYDFGMVMKETMLSLGPTFIKGEQCCLIFTLFFPFVFFLYCSLNYILGLLFFFCSHKITNMLVTCVLLADAVGQSLSTRPDIIGTDITKVR